MAEAYGREYVLQFIHYTELIQRIIPTSILRPNSQFSGQSREAPSLLAGEDASVGYTDFLTVPSDFSTPTGINATGEAKEITNTLRIKAKVTWGKESDTASNSQEATIEIYNMSPETRTFLRKNDTILLRAGYSLTKNDVVSDVDGVSVSTKELPLILTGQARKITTIKKGQDTITKIHIKDAGIVTDNLRISKRYEEGTSYRDIIIDMARFLAANGVPSGYFTISTGLFVNNDFTDGSGKQPIKNLENEVGVQGYVMVGYAMDALKTFCKGVGYRAYTSLGKLYVEPIYSGGYSDYVEIRPENIKGSIREETDTSSKNQTQGDAKSGLIFSTFLNGNIVLEKGISIVGIKEYEGTYKVTNIVHKLDLEGKDWTTEVSVIKETV